jgi:hypothetical protein
MKKILFLFLFISFHSFSQKWLWINGAINPNAKYSHQLNDTVDADGNIYLCGDFDSTVLELGSVLLKNPSGGSASSAFVAKFDKQRNLLWYYVAGGNSFDGAHKVIFDNKKNVYVTGYFRSDTIHFGKISIRNSYPGTNTEDAFLAKFSSGGELLWARGGGGKGIDLGWKVSFDEIGNVIMKGSALSKTIRFNDQLLMEYDTTRTWETMDFAVKFDTNGNVLALWEYDADYKKLKTDLEDEFMRALKDNKVKISCAGPCYGMAFKITISEKNGAKQVDVEKKKICDEKVGQKIAERLKAFALKKSSTLNDLDKEPMVFHLSRILKC